MTGEITAEEIKGLAWRFYFALIAWPVYLFFLPAVYARWGAFSFLFMIFPGLYLFTWVGYCMHECWHKFVPNLPNGALYNLFAWMLISDPQLYRLLHGHHHSEVNTYEDREFHPLGEIKSLPVKRGYHFFEIIFGIAFIVAVSTFSIPRHPRYRDKYRLSSLLLSMVIWLVFLGMLGWLSRMVFGVTWMQIAISYLFTLWLSSFFLHHSQLVEHGNLIVAGDWNQRNIKTRNFRRQTLLEKTLLFLTHNDSREHVLHHTITRVYSRPFPGRLPLPPGAVYISAREYLSVLWDMLSGRNSIK